MKRDQKLINSIKISFDIINITTFKYEIFHIEEKLKKLSYRGNRKKKEENDYCFEARNGRNDIRIIAALQIIGPDHIKIGLKFLV